jgi:hypothetical protein
MAAAVRGRDAGEVRERPGTWLGWPVWLVVAIIIVAAMTGSGAPVDVLLLLGSIGVVVMLVEAAIAGWVQRRWRQGAQADPGPGPDAGDEPGSAADAAAPRAPVTSPDRGEPPPGRDAHLPEGT